MLNKSLFASARVTGLCLYPQTTPQRMMTGVLSTHPLAWTAGKFDQNPLYDSRAR